MAEQLKRHIAFKISIKDLLEANYRKEEGEWSPNYLQIGKQQIARVNVVGAIVAKQEETQHYQSLLLDDGSGKIAIRAFDRSLDTHCIGGIVVVIARPREFNNERYLVPEIVRNVDKKWLEVRRKELRLTPKTVIEPEAIAEPIEPSSSPITHIYEFIRSMDAGDGVLIEEIISKNKSDECEKILK